MFTGVKEILVIVAVLLGLFLVPRLLGSRSKASSSSPIPSSNGKQSKTGMMRLALFISMLWIGVALVLLNPLSGNWMPFLAGGVFPVALAWGIRWVVLGFK